ncbi:MAG: hypothetical protein D6719_11045 [Candidatus Dadabacteria bacterium]|nr:MAG: hypothetical protein D6719_11045 [Candidatus Dadabacteria bacterium]
MSERYSTELYKNLHTKITLLKSELARGYERVERLKDYQQKLSLRSNAINRDFATIRKKLEKTTTANTKYKPVRSPERWILKKAAVLSKEELIQKKSLKRVESILLKQTKKVSGKAKVLEQLEKTAKKIKARLKAKKESRSLEEATLNKAIRKVKANQNNVVGNRPVTDHSESKLLVRKRKKAVTDQRLSAQRPTENITDPRIKILDTNRVSSSKVKDRLSSEEKTPVNDIISVNSATENQAEPQQGFLKAEPVANVNTTVSFDKDCNGSWQQVQNNGENSRVVSQDLSAAGDTTIQTVNSWSNLGESGVELLYRSSAGNEFHLELRRGKSGALNLTLTPDSEKGRLMLWSERSRIRDKLLEAGFNVKAIRILR